MTVYVPKNRTVGPVQHVIGITLTMIVGSAGIIGMVWLCMAWTLEQPGAGLRHGLSRAHALTQPWKTPPTRPRRIA